MRRITVRAKLLWRRLLAMEGTPNAVARGLAIGIFIGFAPLIGVQTLIAILIALILRGNVVASILGTFINNPITFTPIIWLEYKLGSFALYGGLNQYAAAAIENVLAVVKSDKDLSLMQTIIYDLEAILGLGWVVLGPILLGGLFLGVALAVPSYFITAFAVEKIRERRAVKRLSYTRRMVLPLDQNMSAVTPPPVKKSGTDMPHESEKDGKGPENTR